MEETKACVNQTVNGFLNSAEFDLKHAKEVYNAKVQELQQAEKRLKEAQLRFDSAKIIQNAVTTHAVFADLKEGNL